MRPGRCAPAPSPRIPGRQGDRNCECGAAATATPNRRRFMGPCLMRPGSPASSRAEDIGGPRGRCPRATTVVAAVTRAAGLSVIPTQPRSARWGQDRAADPSRSRAPAGTRTAVRPCHFAVSCILALDPCIMHWPDRVPRRVRRNASPPKIGILVVAYNAARPWPRCSIASPRRFGLASQGLRLRRRQSGRHVSRGTGLQAVDR